MFYTDLFQHYFIVFIFSQKVKYNYFKSTQWKELDGLMLQKISLSKKVNCLFTRQSKQLTSPSIYLEGRGGERIMKQKGKTKFNLISKY